METVWLSLSRGPTRSWWRTARPCLRPGTPCAGPAELNWSAELGLSEWTGVTVGTVGGVERVTVLNLERQGLDGVIPSALGRLSGLRELRLSWGNPLTGVIPQRLGWLGNLGLLLLARNQLSVVIPSQLGHLLNLDNLLRRYVQGNAGFSGCVPPRACAKCEPTISPG